MERILKKIVLIIFLLWLQGCSISQFMLMDEIDKVHVLKHTAYLKYNRAYFDRTDLKTVFKNKKYLFAYNKRTKDLGLLLHRGHTYTFYHFFQPDRPPVKFKSSTKKILSALQKRGYTIQNLLQAGYIVQSGLRRYKGVKTLMIEVKDYSKLKKRYEDAIKNYQSASVITIRTTLPAKLIASYFRHYYRRAVTEDQKAQLQRIAKKLKIETYGQNIQNANSVQQNCKPYYYYLYTASSAEIGRYLGTLHSRENLTPAQYTLLQYRLISLQEKKLLQEGSLSELISAYKKNQDPQFKKRIMELLKEQKK